MFLARPFSLRADRGSSRAPAVRSVDPARSCNASPDTGLGRDKSALCRARSRPVSYPRSSVRASSPFLIPFGVGRVNPSLAGRKSKRSSRRNDSPNRRSPTLRRSRLVQGTKGGPATLMCDGPRPPAGPCRAITERWSAPADHPADNTARKLRDNGKALCPWGRTK